MKKLLLGICIVSLITVGSTFAADEAQPEETKASKWSISAGVRSRNVDVDFAATPPPAYANWSSLVRRPHNAGSTDIYNGEPRLEYEDGAVIEDPFYTPPSSPFYDGTANFGADSSVQFGGDFPIYTVTYSARRTSQHSELSLCPLDQDDDVSQGAPYVAARCSLNGEAGLSFLAQYGFNPIETSSGWQQTAEQSLIERQTTYYTTYDIDPFSLPLPGVPFESDMVWLVYNAADWNMTYPFMPDTAEPRQTTDGSQRTLAVLQANSKSDLDVDIHDVLLAVEWAQDISERVTLSLAAGPTINIFDWDMEHTTEWVNQTSGATLQTMTESASDQEILVGASAQVTISLDLDKEGKFFIEGSAAYNWVDEVEVTTESATAEINASSVSGGIGVGVRL